MLKPLCMDGSQPQLAILVYDFSATGVVRNAVRIAGHASAAGIESELWTMRGDGPFRALVPGDVRVVEICRGPAGARGLGRGFANLAAVPRLSKFIAQRSPRILLSAGNHFHFAAGLAYRLAGSPSSVRFIGRASNATPRLGRHDNVLGKLANRLDAMKYSGMHRIVAVSRELADDLILRLRIPPERVSVIPNGIDAAQIARMAAEPLDDHWFAPDAPPVIISAGRLSKQKNYPLLIDAFARVRRQRPARLVVLGEGPRGARDLLLRQARSLGVADDVRLPGYEANPMRYFARARAFVLSSLWEGASNVLLEALACGCPVIATDCPTGVRELLEDGKAGEIVPTGDAAALAEAIIRVLSIRGDEKLLRNNAGRFQLENTLSSYLELISSELAPAVPRTEGCQLTA
jgi:glycosyltransferase involved in cell wall biosynthesis